MGSFYNPSPPPGAVYVMLASTRRLARLRPGYGLYPYNGPKRAHVQAGRAIARPAPPAPGLIGAYLNGNLNKPVWISPHDVQEILPTRWNTVQPLFEGA